MRGGFSAAVGERGGARRHELRRPRLRALPGLARAFGRGCGDVAGGNLHCHGRRGEGESAMSSTIAVARRELAEKRFVFFSALAFALLALVIPLTFRSSSSFRESLG